MQRWKNQKNEKNCVLSSKFDAKADGMNHTNHELKQFYICQLQWLFKLLLQNL